MLLGLCSRVMFIVLEIVRESSQDVFVSFSWQWLWDTKKEMYGEELPVYPALVVKDSPPILW